MDLHEARALRRRLASLTAFSFVRQMQPAEALCALLEACSADELPPELFVDRYAAVYRAFLAVTAAGRDGFGSAVLAQVAYTASDFAQLLLHLPGDQMPYSMLRAGTQDLAALGALCAIEPAHFLTLAARRGVPQEYTETLPAWESHVPDGAGDGRLSMEMLSAQGLPLLAAFHRQHGIGLFAQYPGLCYVGEAHAQDGLIGVAEPDRIMLSDLVLYEKQRQALIRNTEYLLEGRQAANVLLYGDKGTGKSATVKALLNQYAEQGLRIVEVPPAQLSHLPRLFALLRRMPNQIIVFVDDLAFGDSCPEYTALKTVLEGGLEARPDNVVVYATSNRRNLVRQSFSERADDVSERDTLEEKFSLADRFDLRLTFQAPTQEEYLQIVREMAQKAPHESEEENPSLRVAALRWAARRGGFSPRTARQFVEEWQRQMK